MFIKMLQYDSVATLSASPWFQIIIWKGAPRLRQNIKCYKTYTPSIMSQMLCPLYMRQ